MLVAPTTQTPTHPATRAPAGEESLFPEARQLRRRRGLLIATALGALAGIVVLVWLGGGDASTGGGAGRTAALASGPLARLELAGPLAVARDGALYVTDVGGDRVLMRLPDGRFRTVAGNGHIGFSGDGGPATHAELAAVSDLAFGPRGQLYVADGGRVRVVAGNGVIRTIAGDGRAPRTIDTRDGRVPQLIIAGTPALSARLGAAREIARTGAPLSLAFSPSGRLYISTGSQILRLTGSGRLEPVRIMVTAGPLKGRQLYDAFGPIAIDARGDVDAAGFNGWAIWRIARDGVAHEIAYARRSGGDYAVLQPGPNGSIYGESGAAIVRVDADRLVPTHTFDERIHGQYFPLTYFAFSPSDTIYADDLPGDDGFEAHQQLLSVTHGHVRLLWQERNGAPK